MTTVTATTPHRRSVSFLFLFLFFFLLENAMAAFLVNSNLSFFFFSSLFFYVFICKYVFFLMKKMGKLFASPSKKKINMVSKW
jgi:Ca2+/Na+ antiporter